LFLVFFRVELLARLTTQHLKESITMGATGSHPREVSAEEESRMQDIREAMQDYISEKYPDEFGGIVDVITYATPLTTKPSFYFFLTKKSNLQLYLCALTVNVTAWQQILTQTLGDGSQPSFLSTISELDPPAPCAKYQQDPSEKQTIISLDNVSEMSGLISKFAAEGVENADVSFRMTSNGQTKTIWVLLVDNQYSPVFGKLPMNVSLVRASSAHNDQKVHVLRAFNQESLMENFMNGMDDDQEGNGDYDEAS
jgi:hypothetical protein